MSEADTPRLTEEAIADIRARANLARVSTVNDTLGERAAKHVIEHDVPALCREIEELKKERDSYRELYQITSEALAKIEDLRLSQKLQTALGALADIANFTEDEIADGTAQRKAKRIYNEVKGRQPDAPVD